MIHFFLPSFTCLESARWPNSKWSAPITMLFPAPVSPVMTEKPGKNWILSSSISVKSFM